MLSFLTKIAFMMLKRGNGDIFASFSLKSIIAERLPFPHERVMGLCRSSCLPKLPLPILMSMTGKRYVFLRQREKRKRKERKREGKEREKKEKEKNSQMKKKEKRFSFFILANIVFDYFNPPGRSFCTSRDWNKLSDSLSNSPSNLYSRYLCDWNLWNYASFCSN